MRFGSVLVSACIALFCAAPFARDVAPEKPLLAQAAQPDLRCASCQQNCDANNRLCKTSCESDNFSCQATCEGDKKCKLVCLSTYQGCSGACVTQRDSCQARCACPAPAAAGGGKK